MRKIPNALTPKTQVGQTYWMWANDSQRDSPHVYLPGSADHVAFVYVFVEQSGAIHLSAGAAEDVQSCHLTPEDALTLARVLVKAAGDAAMRRTG